MTKRYASLRVVHPVDKLRTGSLPYLITANGERTIEFRGEPYHHFHVLPENVEIPMVNVTSAIPVESGLAHTLARTTGRKRKVEPTE